MLTFWVCPHRILTVSWEGSCKTCLATGQGMLGISCVLELLLRLGTLICLLTRGVGQCPALDLCWKVPLRWHSYKWRLWTVKHSWAHYFLMCWPALNMLFQWVIQLRQTLVLYMVMYWTPTSYPMHLKLILMSQTSFVKTPVTTSLVSWLVSGRLTLTPVLQDQAFVSSSFNQ